jgi:hypothetical protein
MDRFLWSSFRVVVTQGRLGRATEPCNELIYWRATGDESVHWRFAFTLGRPTRLIDALHERVRLKRSIQFSDQIHHHGPDQLRIDFCDRVVPYRATATTIRGISLKVDPPSLAIWPCPEVWVTPEAMTKARVSADGDINPRMAFVRWHSRRHTSLVECLGHLLKGWGDHTGQANCGGFAEILLGRGLARCFIAGLRHPSLVVGEDGVEFLLDVFGHIRYSESTPYT